MKTFNNKSGFTLIEIIVVLIIVGILAAIALPNLFSNVAKSRAEEALGAIGGYRPTIEACAGKYGSASSGSECTSVLLGLPTSANFKYTLGTVSGAAGDASYKITAAGNGSGLTGADAITVTSTSGTVTCIGTGQLLGAC